jgi:hypothetical protein
MPCAGRGIYGIRIGRDPCSREERRKLSRARKHRGESEREREREREGEDGESEGGGRRPDRPLMMRWPTAAALEVLGA